MTSSRQELFARARKAQEDHLAFVATIRERVQPRTTVTDEDLDRQGLLAGSQARVDAGHAAIRDLYEAGVAPDEIARHLGWFDAKGAPEVWKIHQITHTSWCDFCGTAETAATRLSLGVHIICDQCIVLASVVLAGKSPSEANELVAFEKCNEMRVCLFCSRELSGGDVADPYDPLGRDRWWKVPVRRMVQAVRVTGESVAMCDACVEFYEAVFRTPPDRTRRVCLL